MSAGSAYQPLRPARRPGGKPDGAPAYRVLVHRRFFDKWQELPERVGLGLSTERYCHALPDAPEVFALMAAAEQEVAVLHPDMHAHLFPTWASNVAD